MHFVRFTINLYSPIPWLALLDCSLRANASGAVACNGIVPMRMISQLVHRVDVFQKAAARLCRRRQGSVEINVFAMPIIGAHPNGIALIGHDVNKRGSQVKTADS